MITCLYCDTSYTTFQPNCSNCGGPLPLPPPSLDQHAPTQATIRTVQPPPLPPRTLPPRVGWRLLTQSGVFIVGGIFAFIGLIFTLVGAGLTIAIITIFVGLPFLGLGLLFLILGLILVLIPYQKMQQSVAVLRNGEATVGEVVDLYQNMAVQINGRNPWVISYSFQAFGQMYEGKVTSLKSPGSYIQLNQPIHVLYSAANPTHNTIYPDPRIYQAKRQSH